MEQIKVRPKVAVIGGGWYGCHIAKILDEAGYTVAGFEKTNSLLTGAAMSNQLRLHQGLHYLRSGVTRKQALEGYTEFVETYPTLSSEVARNIYAVPALESDLDASTVELILSGSKIPFRSISPSEYPWFQGAEALYLCDERLLNVAESRVYFEQTIGHLFKFNEEVDYSKIQDFLSSGEFDYVIDATYFGIAEIAPEATHEITMLAEFESNSEWFEGGLTLVDGKLWSIYPTNVENTYSVSHVKHSILGHYRSQAESMSAVEQIIRTKSYEANLEAMREHVLKYVPRLRNDLDDMRIRFLTRKVKPLGNSANREAFAAEVEPGLIFIQAGKIDAIFVVGRSILEIVEKWELAQSG